MFGLDDSSVDLEKLTSSLKQHEGSGPVLDGRFMPYKDSRGYLTIGYGRCIQLRGISDVEAATLLRNDIAVSVEEAEQQSWFPLVEGCEPRLRALCEIIFNLGLPKFNSFHKAVAALDRADWAEASAEFLDSQWKNQIGQRAEELCAMILTGNDLFPQESNDNRTV